MNILQAIASFARRRRRALAITLGLLLVLYGVFLRIIADPVYAGAELNEDIEPDEDVYTAQIIASSVAMVNASRQTMAKKAGDYTYRRDVHAKSHACLKATFTVLDGLAPHLRHGMLAAPAKFNAWVRFSSGDSLLQSDHERDARGMAIKLMGVPGGGEFVDGGGGAHTQDVVMINHPVFFIRDIRDYAEFTKKLGEGSRYGFFINGWNPFRWKLRELYLGLQTLKPPPRSLLDTRFWSMSAYRLGPHNYVKYSVRPCPGSASRRTSRSGPNFLRTSLKQELSSANGCFEFMVQMQERSANMPVEDTTVLWDEKRSPFLPVARIEIPRQDFDTDAQNRFCECLSFNPWHTVEEHRPVGVMNRIRRAVYQEVARYRRARMKAGLTEPAADWSFDAANPCR